MKERIIPIILTVASIAAVAGIILVLLALYGDGMKIGDMTYYLS